MARRFFVLSPKRRGAKRIEEDYGCRLRIRHCGLEELDDDKTEGQRARLSAHSRHGFCIRVKPVMQKKLETVTIASEPPPSSCPKCGSTRVAPIRYGRIVPNKKVQEAIAQERYVLGGDVIGPNSPTWHCVGCGHKGGNRRILNDPRHKGDT